MAKLFGEPFNHSELLERVGGLSQVCGIRVSELLDGFERGVRVADMRTGSGLTFSVLVDRGLDIGQATYRGVPLCWRSPVGAIGPAFYEPEGLGWLRGFSGGLLVTCGLTSFGAPEVDQGESLGLHGRASYIPATRFNYGGEWNGDDYEMWVTGEIREARVFGENLVLRRRISSLLGEPRLVIEDSVTNEGFAPAPHMMLYHMNFGFPLLDVGTELLLDAIDVQPRDSVAAAGLETHRRFDRPIPGFREQVIYHTPRVGADGYAQVGLVNRGFAAGQGLGVMIRFRAAELPRLIQWKMIGQGTYVCGLEPATNWVGGRAIERAEGRLTMLEPAETREYRLEVNVVTSLEGSLPRPG